MTGAITKTPKASALDVFQRARARWLAGERIDIGALAVELGLGRATVFRWVGSREQLTGEVLWSFTEPTLREAAAQTRGRGAKRIARICARVIHAIFRFTPLRRFLEAQPDYALRLLTSKAGPVQGRVISAMRALLATEVERGHLEVSLPLDTLAYLIVRICESFVYADLISGQAFNAADAGLAIELLLSGKVER